MKKGKNKKRVKTSKERKKITQDDENSQYIDDLKEWQENQYNPGHFLGGNTSPILKYGGKKIGALFLVIGIFSLIINLFQSFTKKSFMFNNLYDYLFSLFFIVFGYLYLIKKNK